VSRFFADLTPLQTPDYRRLWLSGVVTVIGANLTIFAVPVQIYALTQNSAYVGLSGIFALVPLVVFGLWGGAWADAMDRRKLLIIASVGLAVASVLLWLQAALSINSVWVVMSLLAVQQAFFAINSPTRSAAISRIVPGDQLPAANSLNFTVFQFGAIVGPLLAGVMLRWVDLSTLYLIDAITCIVPIWATVRLKPIPPSNSEAGSSGWGFRAVLDGFRYLAGNTVVLMSFVVDLIAMILGMPRALFPQMAHESFGGPVEGGTTMALLSAAIAVGAVAGGVFSGWLPRVRRQGLAVVWAIVVWGLAMIGFGVAAGLAGGRVGAMLWVALLFLVIGGAADLVSSAFRNTILLQAASDEVRGRLQGVFTVVVAGGPRIADAVHGAAAAAVGTTVAAAGGGALVVVGVVIAALLAPVFVRYRAGTPSSAVPEAVGEQTPDDDKV
jgi:MFS family permease